MLRNLIVTALVAAIMAGFVLAFIALMPPMAVALSVGMASEPGPPGGTIPTVPPAKGYTEGQEIRFIHTEASEPQVAEMLTKMMGSPVLVVPSLALAPEDMLANVYVFQNGVEGEGPFGFQADVLDHPPGDPEHSPLRALNLVSWRNEQEACVLKSACEVDEARARGQVMMTRPGVVVNMPFLTWPGGER